MKYLIIGNGVAGVEAALAIRKNNPDGEITVISESTNLHYYRPKLIDYLADETSLDKFIIYDREFYEKMNIENILNTRIISIIPGENVVVDGNNRRHGFDKLLIATGGKPFIPPIEGVKSEGVFTLRGVGDADRIKDYCRDTKKSIVIGGGLLGLETASSLSKLGKEVTVIEFFDWLLPRQLDQDGGIILEKLLRSKGINFILKNGVSSIDGKNDKINRVILKSGEELEADSVIISAGIRCDLKVAKGSGIEVDNGIVVNNFLQTSVDNIYAAGDVIEHNKRLYGIWPAAREQGNIAGLNMAGISTEYTGTVMTCILKVTGIDLYSAGDIEDEDSEIYVSKNDSSYKKLLLRDNKPVGAIVLGDRDALRVAQKIIDGRADPDEFKKLL